METGRKSEGRRSRLGYWMAAALAGAGSCVFTCAWSSGFGQATTTWETLDSVQVLAGPEEMWLFLEVDRMVHLPGALVEAPTRSMGHRQIVVIVPRNGDVRHIALARENGVSFHENLGRVFHHRDRLHLFTEASMNSRQSVFHWAGDRFELMPVTEGDDLLRANGLAQLSPGQMNPALDALTVKSGWQPILVESRLFNWDETQRRIVHLPESDLPWAGRVYAWEEEESDGVVSVSLRADGGSATIPLLKYDRRPVPLRSQESRNLWSRPHQTGHPR